MKKLLTMALGLALCFTLSIPAFSTWSHTLSDEGACFRRNDL